MGPDVKDCANDGQQLQNNYSQRLFAMTEVHIASIHFPKAVFQSTSIGWQKPVNASRELNNTSKSHEAFACPTETQVAPHPPTHTAAIRAAP